MIYAVCSVPRSRIRIDLVCSSTQLRCDDGSIFAPRSDQCPGSDSTMLGRSQSPRVIPRYTLFSVLHSHIDLVYFGALPGSHDGYIPASRRDPLACSLHLIVTKMPWARSLRCTFTRGFRFLQCTTASEGGLILAPRPLNTLSTDAF